MKRSFLNDADICERSMDLSMKKIYLPLVLLLSGLLLNSCFKKEEFTPETWKHSFKGPLVKTVMDISDLANVQDIKMVDEIKASQLDPRWDGELIQPAITGKSSEDAPQIFEVTDFFKAIHTDSLVVGVKFTNGYPISIGKGTELVFRNEESQTVFFREAITNNIEPGETYNFDIEVLSGPGEEPQKVESNIEFYLDNFRTTGSGGEVVDFTNATTTFEFTLHFINVVLLEFFPDKIWSDTVTTVFSLFEEGAVNQEIIEGDLSLFFNNSLPVRGFTLVEVFDMEDRFLGSLTSDTVRLKPGSVDQTTADVLETAVTSVAIPISNNKVDWFYDKVQLRIVYDLNTNNIVNSGTILVGEDSHLKTRLVGDFDLYVDRLELDSE